MMRFGITINFCLSYFGSASIFDVDIKSRSFSVNNFFARLFTIGSPVIANVIPKPVLVISFLCLIAMVASQFIEKKPVTETERPHATPAEAIKLTK